MNEPQLGILIQPKQHGQRFRYRCESKSAGSLIGEGSTNEQKVYPTVEIKHLNGLSAIIVVSCVSRDSPHYPHPHNLVGANCKDGVCTIRLKPQQNTVNLMGVGIQCCKRNEVNASLAKRQSIRVDPFATGPQTTEKIDLSVVRLCFQAFLPDVNRRFTRVISPIVSEPIIDKSFPHLAVGSPKISVEDAKETVHELVIVRLSLISGSVNGGDDMIILCEKVKKDDIQIRFFEQSPDGELVWEAYPDVNDLDVHHQTHGGYKTIYRLKTNQKSDGKRPDDMTLIPWQPGRPVLWDPTVYAIVLKTPPYRNPLITEPVMAFLQLHRPSTNDFGDPRPFMYRPNDQDPEGFNAKRRKTAEQSYSSFMTDFSHLPKTLLPFNDEDSSSIPVFVGSSAPRTKSKPAFKKGTQRDLNDGMSTALPSYSFENIGTSFATLGDGSVPTLAADSGRYIQDDLPSVVLPNGSSVPLSSLAASSSVFLSPGMMDARALTGVSSGYSQSQLMPAAVGQMNDSLVGGSDTPNLVGTVAGTLDGSDSLNLDGTVSGTLTSEELTQYIQSGSVLTEMRSDEFLRQFEGIVFQQTYDGTADLPPQSSKVDPETSEH